MGDEPGHQLPVVNFTSNGFLSALPPPDSLPPAPATDSAGGFAMNGDGSLFLKRKRGRPPKMGGGKAKAVDAPAAKRTKEEEDVCFICFDGGNLVLCDRRDCPKAYHPACVKRDESFFKKRLRWNCGWHLCNICQRNAIFMCYTCPYSLCKTCVKQADISCVRGFKGFCKNCMATISLIENIKQGNEEVDHVDFDDKASWEYLFKVYWVYLKRKESLTLDELTRTTNPWKGLLLNHVNKSSLESQNTCIDRTVELISTVSPLGKQNNQVETNVSKRRKTRKQLPLQNNSRERIVADNLQGSVAEWASAELLEFVAHVKNGDTSKLTHFDVQALLLEYIRRNKLRDPRKKCQIICDKRLEILFGKTRVGHFEMLKLLEYHFRDGSCASSVVHAAAIDSSDNQRKVEHCIEEVRERKRQMRRKVDKREIQIDLDNFAAIDAHNISLIYMKRSSIENLMEDAGKFQDKVVGSIVRIRISGNDLKQEMYRLVRVVGTGKADEPYQIGDNTSNFILKVLNLDKTEDVRIDAISNQDFSEDECRRLRQSIKCGLVERLTVGEVHEKAVAFQELRIKDVLETEILKLNHLRDRASEMGHRKELRECVKKLELLKSPEECQRRLRKMPEVHSDPRMDPIYQSDEDSEQSDTKQDGNSTPVHSNSISRIAEPNAHQQGDMPCSTSAKLLQSSSFNSDCMRNGSVPQLIREDVAPTESSQSSFELETDAARILEELRNQGDPGRIINKHEDTTLRNHPHEASVTPSFQLAPSLENLELDKMWHYRDPSGKVQGPFCMMQLRKWNSSGFFPVDLRVWRIDECQDKSMLLADALSNQCGKAYQIQSDCLESLEARSATECKNLEHGRQPNININATWTGDEPNGGCNTDLTDADKCSDDVKQPITDNSGRGAIMDSGSQFSPKENRNPLQVASSSGQDVSNASPASRDTVFATMPDLPSPTPKDDKEGFKCMAVESEQQLSAPNISSSSPRMSSGGLDPAQPSSIIKPETDHLNIKEQAEENKLDNEVENENQEVTQIALDHNLGSSWKPTSDQMNFFNISSQIPDLNNAETKSQVAEVENPCNSRGTKDTPVEQCLTSNATCQDVEINWSTVNSLVTETVQWAGCPMQTKSCTEAGMKIGDHPTPTTGCCQFTNPMSAHPDCNTSSWADGPIELSTLGDESVSDLLTEVEAYESLHGLPSPNSRVDFGDDSLDSPSNDCFSRLIAESHPHYQVDLHNCPPNPTQLNLDFASAQQDFLSLTSTSLLSPVPALNSQSSSGPGPAHVKTLSLTLHSPSVESHGDLFTSLSLSSPVSSRGPVMESNGKLNNVSNSSNHEFLHHHNREPPPPPPPQLVHHADMPHPPPPPPPPFPPPPTSSIEMEPTDISLELSVQIGSGTRLETSSPVEDRQLKPPSYSPIQHSYPIADTSSTRRVTVNAKPSWGASQSQGPGVAGHGHQYSNQGNRESQQPRNHSRGGRHSSGHHNSVDAGFHKSGRQPTRHRQASFNGSVGGGALRPVLAPPSQHRGQRVCKFYESGYCKKGASCNYLHP